MLGANYNEFMEKFSTTFNLIDNVLQYKSTFIYIKYYKPLSEYDLFDLFFRFSDSIKAFDYYRKWHDYDVVCHLCDIYYELYKILQYENDIITIKHKLNQVEVMLQSKLEELSYFGALKWTKNCNKNIIQIEQLEKYVKQYNTDLLYLNKLY